MATQSISLHGIKSHTLARIHNEQESARYIQPDSRFSSIVKTEGIRPPIYEDFNSFLASSTSQIHQQFSEETKATISLQNSRFETNNIASTQKPEGTYQTKQTAEKSAAILSLEKITSAKVETPKPSEVIATSSLIQPPKQSADKGYGSRITTNPSITMACTTDVAQISMGLVNAIHERSPQHDANDFQKFNEENHKIIKSREKIDNTSRNEHAQLLRREEIEILREVKEKFQQQLNTQYPHITVPLKHPEGIMDIHMRFDKKATDSNNPKGSVRVMFSGSNDQIVALFAQHRQEFMDIINQEGFSIDHSKMQFNGPNLSQFLKV